MADSLEEVNVGGKNAGNGTFAALYCAIFRTPSFGKSLKFFGTSSASLNPETVQLPAFSRSVWPRFGTALERPAHDCDIWIISVFWLYLKNLGIAWYGDVLCDVTFCYT